MILCASESVHGSIKLFYTEQARQEMFTTTVYAKAQ